MILPSLLGCALLVRCVARWLPWHVIAISCGVLGPQRCAVTLLELCYQLQCDIAADPEHRADVVERYRRSRGALRRTEQLDLGGLQMYFSWGT